MHLIRHTLLDQQLDAIKRVLRTHEEIREGESNRLDALDTASRWEGEYDGGLEALRDLRFWQMTFQTSAHSMAAVGMLAPFIESLFEEIFDALKTRSTEIKSDHPPQDLPFMKSRNPQSKVENGKTRQGFAVDSIERAYNIGLLPFLPCNVDISLKALIKYRNNMFHNGFEWPETKISSFDKKRKDWPEGWFDLAHRNGEPWLFFMTPEFCTHCIDLIDAIIDGTGRFLKERDDWGNLDKHRPEIEALLANGSTQKFIAKRYKSSPANLANWMKKRGIKKPKL